jgi:crossover junction endodeoxyribonuclease RusA
LKIDLPYPPSNNTFYRSIGRGKVLISEGGRKYKTEVYARVLEQHGIFKPFTGPVKITVELTPPDKRKRDLDNCFKGLFDSLTAAGCWIDDVQVKIIYAEMLAPSKPGACTVIIEEL